MKKNLMRFLLIIMLFILTPVAAHAEGAYDRVMKSQTLRCGYGVFPPMVVKDPNSGELSGIFVDIMKEVGKASNLKIDFVQEVDWGQIGEALRSGKIDAFCAGMWGTAKRAKDIAFSKPLFYSGVKAYARPDDTRFDKNPEAINNTDVKISVTEGDVSEDIANRFFPKAQKVYKTSASGEEFVFMNVSSKKADVAITAPSTAKAFIKNNPGSMREIPLGRPVSIYPNVIGVDIHEQELQDLLNASVADLNINLVINRIISQYPPKEMDDFILDSTYE